MIDKISRFTPREGKRPPKVSFSSGESNVAIWDGGLAEIASRAIGQQVEYEIRTEQKGQYTNHSLTAIRPIGGSATTPPAQQAASPEISNETVALLRRIADGVDRLVALGSGKKVFTGTFADQVAQMEAALQEVQPPAGASAQVEAVLRRFGFTRVQDVPEVGHNQVLAGLGALLAEHGIQV